MAEDLTIKARLQGGRQVAQESKRMAGGIDDVGDAADRTKRDAREMGSALTKAGAAGRRGGGMLAGGLGKALALTGGFYTLARGISFAAGEYDEAARVGAQTGAVIKSTGGAAKVTRREVETLAGALSLKTGIDDEAIQSGSNLLLTFKEIRNEAGRGNRMFDRTTAGALDLSAAGFGSVESASVMLGKALNDPVKGITALGRAGVTFTDRQKEQIKTLAESGDMLGAQKLIMRELESQVKGSAKAQRQPIDSMKVGFGNLAESVAGLFAPAVNRQIEKGADVLADLNEHLSPILGQENLTLGEKWDLTLPVLKQDFAPLTKGLGDALEDAEVAENLSKAFEAGAPIFVDAVAASAPRAAGAFVNAFMNAGPWGQLLTIGFLAKKLGAFSLAGDLAAGSFKKRFASKLTLGSIFRTAAVAGAAEGAAAGATTMAASSGKGSLLAAVGLRSKRWMTVGRLMGGIIGKALAIYIPIEFWRNRDYIEDMLGDLSNEVFGMFGGDPIAPSTGGLSPDDTRPREAPPGTRRRQKGKGAPEQMIAPDGRVWQKNEETGAWDLIKAKPLKPQRAMAGSSQASVAPRLSLPASTDEGLREVVRELAAAARHLATVERPVLMDGAQVGKQIARHVARDQAAR